MIQLEPEILGYQPDTVDKTLHDQSHIDQSHKMCSFLSSSFAMLFFNTILRIVYFSFTIF